MPDLWPSWMPFSPPFALSLLMYGWALVGFYRLGHAVGYKKGLDWGCDLWEGAFHYTMGGWLRASKRPEEAKKHFLAAYKHYEELGDTKMMSALAIDITELEEQDA